MVLLSILQKKIIRIFLTPVVHLQGKYLHQQYYLLQRRYQKIDSSSESSEPKKRGLHYKSFSPDIKAEIEKYVAENGVASTLRRYVSQYPGLKESTVRTWKTVYSQELKKRVRSGTEMCATVTSVQELPSKKRGRPYLLGEELDKRVRSYLIALRERGGVVNTAIVLACALLTTMTATCWQPMVETLF